MDDVDISIVIMTYMKFENFERNISSIVMQKGPNYEIIISDDHSKNFNSDYIISVLKKNKIKNYTIIDNAENIGTVRNYANAISKSKGRYIVPLSQDDYFATSDALMKIFDAFEISNADYVYSKRIGEKSQIVLPNDYDWKLLNSGKNRRILQRISLSNCVSGASFCLRKTSFYADGGFDFDFYLLEDYPFVYKTIINKKKVIYLDYITIVYGENGVSSSRRLSSKLVEDYKLMSLKYLSNNVDIFNHNLSKDYVRRRYKVYQHYDKKIYILLLGIKYFRLTLLNLKILFLRQKKDSIFQYLIDREVEMETE